MVHPLPADLGRTLAPCMAELKADLGQRMPMHEIDDPPPRITLGGVPEARASRRDPRIRRHAGHLCEEQPRTAGRAGAVMDEMPIARQTVDGRILRHRGDGHTVDHRHAAQRERGEHRRAPVLDAAARRQRPLDLLDVGRIAQTQVRMTDALAAREQAVGELPRLEPGVTVHVLEPFHAVAGCVLQFERLEGAFLMVAHQTVLDRRGPGDVRHERHRILHRQLGARSDAEVRRMRRIADQHQVAVMPALAEDAVEAQPRRTPQMPCVAHQPMAVEMTREQPLAERDRFFGGREVESMRPPGLIARLDDDGREVAAELVRVDLEPAMLGALEREGERVERPGGPEPDEPALAHVDVGLEHVGMAGARAAVHAVGGDHQIGVAPRGVVVHLMLEVLHHAEAARALLQYVEQALAADAAEAMAAGPYRHVPMTHLDVVPVMEIRDDRVMRLRIDGPEPLHRLVGEHHTPAEGVVRTVALMDLDLRLRMRFLDEDGGIQPCRSAAERYDASHLPLAPGEDGTGTSLRITPSTFDRR